MKVRIYTDGACSCNPGPGGWAAIILLPNKVVAIDGNDQRTTNNRMELQAVVEGLRFAKSLGHANVDVYSDSAYVVNAVGKEWLKKWKNNGWKAASGEDVKNKDLWLQLLGLLGRYIRIIKVKGHSGDTFNEKADILARAQVDLIKEQMS